jgi:hypothetical protein
MMLLRNEPPYRRPQNKFIPFIFYASIIFFLLDVITNPCFLDFFTDNQNLLKKFSMLEFLFLHHLLAVILYFGWLSESKLFLEFYVLLVLLIVFHWMTNDQMCILTQIINWFCGIDEREPFHDIFWLTGMKDQNWFNSFIYTFLIFGFIISLIKISA